MMYERALRRATLVRRYKRFLADVIPPEGESLTVHCPNTGSMLGCIDPGIDVWLSRSDNPKRKYAHTLEQVEVDGVRIGIHTGRPNALVEEAIRSGVIESLSGYEKIEREVVIEPGTRLDLVLSHPGRRRCLVEVKNVSAAVEAGVAFFPDSVSARARKHLEVLARAAASGQRAVLVYCVQRDDVVSVRPADHIDPDYGRTLRDVMRKDVEVVAYAARLNAEEVTLYRRVPVDIRPTSEGAA
ncbi:MAG: DNA/RNA nuclease SfsA [Pseudomonadota bacterium]